MPITMEFREEGRVLFLTYVDPIRIADMESIGRHGRVYRDSVNHTVHAVFDFIKFHHPPFGILRMRYAPLYTHPRSGKIIYFGANPAVHKLFALTADLAGNPDRVRFFDEAEEAWDFVSAAIAQDKRIEMSSRG